MLVSEVHNRLVSKALLFLFFTDDDFKEDDYVRYTLSIHSSQPLFIDEVNATKFEQLRYAPADALITLAKQSKMEEHSDSRETSIRISQVIFLDEVFPSKH